MPSAVNEKKIPHKKKQVPTIKSKKSSPSKSDQDYQEMIAEAAYYKAELRGFVPGFEEEDWLEAENEIISMLNLH